MSDLIELIRSWFRSHCSGMRRALRYARMISSPYVLPSSYRERLTRYEKAEKHLFPSDTESELARLRMYSHGLDKGMYRPDWSPGHGRVTHNTAARILEDHDSVDDPTVSWARRICAEYERRHSPRAGAAAFDGTPALPSPLDSETLLQQWRSL